MPASLIRYPLGFHGTSAEAVQIMFEEGRLRPSSDSPIKGEIYFAPVTARFGRSSYAVPLLGRFTQQQAFSTARFYAGTSSREHFLISQLGFLPRHWQNIADDERRAVRYCLADDHRVKLSDQQIDNLVDRMFQRRGFVIEPAESVFRYYDYGPGDDPCVIAVKCSRGLPLKHIRKIHPLGQSEARLLKLCLDC